MSHETPTIAAQARQRTGSRYAQRLRKAGQLPAVIYGHQQDPAHVSVNAKEVVQHLQHGAHVMNIEVDGAKHETCLVKDLQFGYLGDDLIHIDFARVNLDEEVTVLVHLKFTGEPKAAEEDNAIVNYDVTELEVVCKVTDIPDEIKVDLSEVENTLNVSDIALPAGLKATMDPDLSVVHVSYVAEEEPEAEEVEVGAEAAAEPEVISEAKEEEGDEGEES